MIINYTYIIVRYGFLFKNFNYQESFCETRYGAYAMVVTGCTLLSTVGVYYWLLPTTPLVIHLEGAELRFRLGWAFYAIAIAGCVCVTIGILVAGLDLAYPNRFSTILELDYDTPYDRHMILAKVRN